MFEIFTEYIIPTMKSQEVKLVKEKGYWVGKKNYSWFGFYKGSDGKFYIIDSNAVCYRPNKMFLKILNDIKKFDFVKKENKL